MQIDRTRYTSLNHGPRRDGAQPRLLIIHYTDMPSLAMACARLCDPETQVSAHYAIAEDGSIFELVPPERRAWHAGRSHWRGCDDINSASIGIELQNLGASGQYPAFAAPQITALIALCQHLVANFAIHPQALLGHQDIAPGRKEDPGPAFPWRQLAEAGLGWWPTEPLVLQAEPPAPSALATALRKLGYDPTASDDALLAAFYQHFWPEARAPFTDSLLTDTSWRQKMAALIAQALTQWQSW